MATDILHESPGPPQPVTARPAGARRAASAGRWLIRLLFFVGLPVLLVFGFTLLPDAVSSQKSGPRLTHTVTRGDLAVTVTEQGTLESSENTEIKCRVRGQNTVIWVVENGSYVEPGDELVRLDTLFIEEQINERTKYAHWSRSASERSKADVANAKLAIKEYEEGRYVAQMMTLEKDMAIARSNLLTAQNMEKHTKSLFDRGYRSQLDVDDAKFAVRQAELEVESRKTQIDVLRDFTRKEQLKTLRGNFAAVTATHKANVERAEADASRRDRALIELGYCVMKAERSGLVIYPSAAAWKNAPDIEEGASVHKDQVLLLMPDLSKMQVKIGIHESIIDRVRDGLKARVTLPDRTLDAAVSSVATITRPAGWWTGNIVKYDTVIQLPSEDGLKPGMSAEVDVILAEYEDVLTIPTVAVIETADGAFCWLDTPDGTERRSLKLGDSNDIFVVVESGVNEGDEVVLNPLAYIEEAQQEVLKQHGRSESKEQGEDESDGSSRDAASSDSSETNRAKNIVPSPQ